MRTIVARISLLFLILVFVTERAEPIDQPIRKFDVSRLVLEVRSVIHQYYPEATIKIDAYDDIRVEHNTRVFLIHYPTKTGEWQEASEVSGPRLGGIFLALGVRDGDYAGPAFLPMTTDRCYFSEYVTVFYSESIDAYVHLTLRYLNEYPSHMMSDIEVLLSNFELWLDF
jgi:hypothetical protein